VRYRSQFLWAAIKAATTATKKITTGPYVISGRIVTAIYGRRPEDHASCGANLPFSARTNEPETAMAQVYIFNICNVNAVIAINNSPPINLRAWDNRDMRTIPVATVPRGPAASAGQFGNSVNALIVMRPGAVAPQRARVPVSGPNGDLALFLGADAWHLVQSDGREMANGQFQRSRIAAALAQPKRTQAPRKKAQSTNPKKKKSRPKAR
jgi:hypothetical protein